MSTPTRNRSLFALDWVSLPRFTLGTPGIRIEEFVDGEMYVVRAEVPGVDPTRDVQVAIVDGELRIRVERADSREARGSSEFQYGSFDRTVPLPAGAREDGVTATYDRGILDVRLRLGPPLQRGREIPVRNGGTGPAGPNVV
jgi:HSP20 family protein